MNYKKHYDTLIERAKSRSIIGYTENHHIVPKCMGGGDSNKNIVALTAREHFIAHQLLAKIYPKHIGLVNAMLFMCCSSIYNQCMNNRLYEWIKVKFAKIRSEAQTGSGNSQFGTMWVHNVELEKNKKWNKAVPIEDGWLKGRVMDFSKIKTKQVLKEKKQLNKQQVLKSRQIEYTNLYELYRTVGWEEFIELTGYKYSQPNLVNTFIRYVPEFKPQNGKKRG